MVSYTIRRLLAIVPVIFVTTTILFALFFLLPGNPIDVVTGSGSGKSVPEGVRRNVAEKFHLDDPWYVQYANYMKGLLHGDLGVQTRTARPVSDVVREKVPPSIRLAAWAIAIETIVGIGVGIIAAVFKYSFWDVLTTVLTTALVGIPVFVLGFLLQYAFGVLPNTSDLPFWLPFALFTAVGIAVVIGIAVQLRKRVQPTSFTKRCVATLGLVVKWFVIVIIPTCIIFSLLHSFFGWFDGRIDYPGWYQLKVSGYPPDGWFLFFFPKGDGWRYLILPAIVLASVSMAIVARMTRSSLLEVMQLDYMRTAAAKGLTKRQTIMRHGLRNALIPVVTLIGLDLGTLIGAAILTETVFSWPGMGTEIRDSIGRRDMPTALGLTIVVVLIFLLINLLVDISYAILDPRLRRNMGEDIE